MNNVSAFFERNIVAVFFLYGLAFFSMGLAVWLESRRASEFRIARSMGFLAGFGIAHGIHEWMKMFLQFGTVNSAGSSSLPLAALDVGLLTLSFLLLIIFGARLIYANHNEEKEGHGFALVLAALLTVVWFASLFAIRRLFDLCPIDCLNGMDILTRYMLGVPGALLAAWAMVLEQRAFRAQGMHGFGRDLLWAALAMFLYGAVGQVFTERSFLFPSTVINAELFLQLFGFPIQLLRALTAGVIAVSVIRALRAFEHESRQRLAAANEARLTAQREALEAQRRAQAETEQLNKELRAAVQDLSTLWELSRSLTATLERDALLKQAVTKIARSVPRVEAGMILFREESSEPLQVVASTEHWIGIDGDTRAPSCAEDAYRVGKWVLDSGEPALCKAGTILALGTSPPEDGSPAEAGILPGENARAIGVPLEVQDRVVGSLVLGVAPDASPLTGRDISLIGTIASQLGIAIENASLYQEVQEREELQRELLHQVVSAQEQERQRIARELHDQTGQALTALGLGLAASSESLKSDPELASQQLSELKELSSRALEELHELVADLRPSLLDDLGLVPALRKQVQDFESRTGVPATFTVTGQRHRVNPEVETILFRIAQEALTNAAKHAKANKVSVRLQFVDSAIALTVRDNGRGFHPAEVLSAGPKQRRAWGLLGIQERVSLVGGSFEIDSQPGEGTTVQVHIPIEQNKEMPRRKNRKSRKSDTATKATREVITDVRED